MRPGRGGRPHLLCPPCPPIGRGGGPGADTTSLGAEPGGPRGGKAVRGRRGRCTGQRARRSHGRPSPAFRALSGTEELCHRSARGPRSKDRGREAVSGRGSRHSTKLVSTVRIRGVSTVQSDRICIPRICFHQSHRKPRQRRRHAVAHLLGGVRPVRAGRVLQRSTPVLVPFLLRGQVRLPVVLHDTRTLERGADAVSPRGAPAVPKASRCRGPRGEPSQRPGPGRGGRNNQGRAAGPGPQPGIRHPGSNGGASGGTARRPGNQPPGKPEPSAERPLKPAPGSRADTPAGDKGRSPPAPLSARPSVDAPTELRPGPSDPPKSPSPPGPATAGESQAPAAPGARRVSGSASGFQVASRGRGQLWRQATARGRAQPRAGPDPPAPQAASPPPEAPAAPATPAQTRSKAPSEPGDPDPDPKPGPAPPALAPGTASAPRPLGLCSSDSSLEYLSECTTEVTCNWPPHRHRPRCPRHCWILKHLAH